MRVWWESWERTKTIDLPVTPLNNGLDYKLKLQSSINSGNNSLPLHRATFSLSLNSLLERKYYLFPFICFPLVDPRGNVSLDTKLFSHLEWTKTAQLQTAKHQNNHQKKRFVFFLLSHLPTPDDSFHLTIRKIIQSIRLRFSRLIWMDEPSVCHCQHGLTDISRKYPVASLRLLPPFILDVEGQIITVVQTYHCLLLLLAPGGHRFPQILNHIPELHLNYAPKIWRGISIILTFWKWSSPVEKYCLSATT